MTAETVTIEREPLWTRSFVLAIGVSFLVSLVFITLVTTTALYAVDRFQASEGLAGLAAGAFVLGAVGSRVIFGKFLDVVGRRRTILIALAVFLLATLLYHVADSFVLLILVRLFHGAAFGVSHTAVTASVMALIPARRRSEGTGYYGVANSLVLAIGPLLAVFLVEQASYSALFAFANVCAAGALIVALFLRPPEAAEPVRVTWRYKLSDIVEPAVLGVAGIIVLAGAAYSGVMVFLITYAQSLGIGEVAASYFLVYACVVLISRLTVGRLQDRYGDNAVIYPTLASFVIGLLLLSMAPSLVTFMVSAAFMAMGFGTLIPCMQAIAVTAVPSHRIGVTISTFFIALDVGTGLGPVVVGVLATYLGYQGMYATMAGVVAIAAVLYHFAHGFRRYRPA